MNATITSLVKNKLNRYPPHKENYTLHCLKLKTMKSWKMSHYLPTSISLFHRTNIYRAPHTSGKSLNTVIMNDVTYCRSNCLPCFQVNWLFWGTAGTSVSLVSSETYSVIAGWVCLFGALGFLCLFLKDQFTVFKTPMKLKANLSKNALH